MKKQITILLGTASLLLSGCSGFLTEYSQDLVIPNTVQDLDETLLGSCYIKSQRINLGPTADVAGFFNILDDDVNTAINEKAPSQFVSNRTWRDVLSGLFGYYAWQMEVGRNYANNGTTDDSQTMSDLYGRINKLNQVLDRLTEISVTGEEEQEAFYRVRAEALFLRGQFYFTLVNLYGAPYEPNTANTALGVPLKLSTFVEYDPLADTQFRRATVSENYAQIVADLEASVADFQKVTSPQTRLHRASIEAAELLLSRVYLYMQDWAKAEQMADRVIKSDRYPMSVLGDLNAEVPFLTEGNGEIIFSQGSNYLAPPEFLTGQAADMCVTKELYDLYADNDHRKSNYFRKDAYTDSLGLNLKYDRQNENPSHIGDAFTLRTTEAYLNKAEACAMQDGKEAEANALLNQIRANRIDGYEAQTYGGAELVDQIRTERRKELCFEGHRWFDLRRYAVDKKYPLHKNIVHVCNVFDDNFKYITTVKYIIASNDPSYIFAIPGKIINFDRVPMEQNERNPRKGIIVEKTIEESEPTDEIPTN